MRTAYRRWKILSRPKKRFGNILLERSPKMHSALITLAVFILRVCPESSGRIAEFSEHEAD